jgi:hypothetical protein
MSSEMRMTRQGLRDLNYYGPKRVPATTSAPAPVEEPAIAPTVAVASEPVAVAAEKE